MLKNIFLVSLAYFFLSLVAIYSFDGSFMLEEFIVQSLEFVHITKTGGTAIEAYAAKTGVKWGACHYGVGALRKYDTCLHKDLNPRKYGSLSNSDENELPNELTRFKFLPWHTPPHWFKENPLAGSKTFAVIRNPYDRVVSEYYSKWGGYYEVAGCDNNPKVMNDWIQEKAKTYVSSNGHFLPQHYYVYNTKGEKVVDHILRFENLDEDFSKLMKKYSLNVRLGKEDVRDKDCTLTADNLSKETIEIINTIYSEDFSLLGYSKRSE